MTPVTTRRKRWLVHAWTAIEFTLKNFATPIAFFWMFRVHGAKPAIALAMVVTTIQLLAHWLLKLSITPFFLVASGFTVLFGGMDLMIQTPRFFRLEPFAQNLIMALVFYLTLFTRVPIIAWFAASLPEKLRPDLEAAGTQKYLRNVTLVWATYFLIKSLVFLYLALTVDLGRLIVLRTLIGGGSLVVMFVGELAYRKWIRKGVI